MNNLDENEIEKQRSLLHFRDIEILQLKREITLSTKYIADLRSSVSFRIGQFFVRPVHLLIIFIKKIISLSRISGSLLIKFISNPIRGIKSLTFRNIKTLFNAFLHEPNSLILENYDRLVNKLDIQNQTSQDFPDLNPVKPIVLYISPNLPDYDTSSGGKRATRMIELLLSKFEVILFTSGQRPIKYVQKLHSLGAKIIESNDSHTIPKILSRIDSIIFAWFYTLHDHGHLMRSYPMAKIIVDSVDVHWIREERSIGILKNLTSEQVVENKNSEINSFSHADIIWAVTENDKNHILTELPKATVHVVSNIHDIEHRYKPVEGNNLLFLGGFNHYPNISSAIDIAENIFPIIKKSIPDAILLVAGSNAPDEIVRLGELDGVEFLGFIEEDELASLYSKSKMALVPLTAGAGIKGKICEAIAFGLPVATNSIGNEGINLINHQDALINDCKLPLIRTAYYSNNEDKE